MRRVDDLEGDRRELVLEEQVSSEVFLSTGSILQFLGMAQNIEGSKKSNAFHY